MCKQIFQCIVQPLSANSRSATPNYPRIHDFVFSTKEKSFFFVNQCFCSQKAPSTNRPGRQQLSHGQSRPSHRCVIMFSIFQFQFKLQVYFEIQIVQDILHMYKYIAIPQRKIDQKIKYISIPIFFLIKVTIPILWKIYGKVSRCQYFLKICSQRQNALTVVIKYKCLLQN